MISRAKKYKFRYPSCHINYGNIFRKLADAHTWALSYHPKGTSYIKIGLGNRFLVSKNIYFDAHHDILMIKIFFQNFPTPKKGVAPGGQMASIQETTASRICLLYFKLTKTVEKCRGQWSAYGLALSYCSTSIVRMA